MKPSGYQFPRLYTLEGFTIINDSDLDASEYAILHDPYWEGDSYRSQNFEVMSGWFTDYIIKPVQKLAPVAAVPAAFIPGAGPIIATGLVAAAGAATAVRQMRAPSGDGDTAPLDPTVSAASPDPAKKPVPWLPIITAAAGVLTILGLAT